MTSHVHMILGTKEEKMQNIIRDLKKYTSKAILKAIEDNVQESRKEWLLWIFKSAGKKNCNNKKYQFWQQNNNPIELSDNNMMDQRLEYIHNNPVKEGFVNEVFEYKYSSAIDYAGDKGLIDIEIIE